MSGSDIDGLEPDAGPAAALGRVSLSDRFGDLVDCVRTGELPCATTRDGTRSAAVVHFTLDLSGNRRPKNLTLALVDASPTVVDDWFEDGLLALQRQLPDGRELVCCLTCQFSDYSPAGHGLMGMRCHRDQRDRYLEVRSKSDYFDVAVTEDVPETYLCGVYEPRVPGTGYRG